ncbi:hypothetical protein HY251_15845 [bacterium]|nr:hypothetical protein [bacterium]
MLAAEGDQSLLGKINKVPRVVWIACSVISLIVAYQAISTTMRLVNYESAIGEEIMKLNRFGVDIRGKTLEILKKDGITPKPEEIQLVIYQNIQKDARVWAYATVRSPQIHIQAQKRLTTKESIDIAIASGFELVYNDASKVWPDGPGAGRQLRIFFGFLFMVVFAAMAYTLGKG